MKGSTVMLEYLKNETNKTYTENGAVTFHSAGNACVDLFATIGALRHQSEQEIITRFQQAYAEDPDIAMRILFFARDVRGGLGERRVFRTVLLWLANNEKNSVVNNLPYVPEYGRWDDLVVLLNSHCSKEAIALLKKQYDTDCDALKTGDELSLLGKWLPSVNASSAEAVRNAKMIAREFGLSDAQYRKSLTALRARIRIVENNLREKDYSFDYSKQPSKAMLKYRRAFIRNDKERYNAFMGKVNRGEAKVHTGTLYPYEIVERAYNCNEEERLPLNTTWNALEDFTTDENALVVADGSGSMYCNGKPMPAAVAQSLAIFFAERNKGLFHNHFITFSMNPQLVEIRGTDIVEKVRYCKTFDECANTNILKVFELILNTAVSHHLSQSDLPSTLYIISDMEFDSCAVNASLSNFEYAKKLYEEKGYSLPKIVFWNVESRNKQQPVRMNEQGVALVSGCSPRIFSMVMEDNCDPYIYMMNIVNSPRYEVISA